MGVSGCARAFEHAPLIPAGSRPSRSTKSLVYQLNGPHGYDKYKKLHWKVAAGLNYALFRNGPAASNLIKGGAFWWGDKTQATPDIQYFMVVGAGIEEGVDAVPGGNGCTVNLGQIRPRSRGEVTLLSADPAVNPRVAPRYFSVTTWLLPIPSFACMASSVFGLPMPRSCRH